MLLRISTILASFTLLCACGGRGYSPVRTAAAPLAASVTPGAEAGVMGPVVERPPSEEQLVIEGDITAKVTDVETASEAIRTQVRASGGRVVQDRADGSTMGWSSFLKLRVKPSAVDGLVEWLADNGTIVSKQIDAQDVSKELFDRELALTNLRTTLARMQSLLERPDLDIEAVLKIETEMTRVRGQIEALEGEQRFLKDRVAYATLDIHLSREDGQISGPQTKFLPTLRLASLHLLDPGDRTRTRTGAGFAIYLPQAHVSYELDIFDAVDGDKRGILATVGGATYSDHLGGGRRSVLNPYIGMRLGYGRLEGSNFVFAGDIGVELFKNESMMVDLNLRTTAFFGKGGPDLAVVPGLGVSVAF